MNLSHTSAPAHPGFLEPLVCDENLCTIQYRYGAQLETEKEGGKK